MRNFVAKNDFNRASVHPDQKKDWEPDIETGLTEWQMEGIDRAVEAAAKDFDNDLISDLMSIARAEYSRGVRDSGIC